MAFNGGLLGKKNVIATTSTSGIWTVPYAGYSASWPPSADTQSALLLHANETPLIDSSHNALAISAISTAGAVPVYSTARAKFGTGSIYYAVHTGHVALPSNADLTLSGDFTIDMWVYKSTTALRTLIGSDYNVENQQIQFDEGSVSGKLGIYHVSTGWLSYACGSSPLDTWFHIAVTRSGSTLYVFFNGVLKGSGTSAQTYNFSGGSVGGLRNYASGGGMVGYLDEIRVVKGFCNWTSAFTPPTSQY